MSGPLDGVKVLDLTLFPPGAYCTVLLRDLGADVVRVQRPGADPRMMGVGMGLARGKRSIAVDQRHEHGNEVVARLAGWADVVVENNRPGELAARGFGYPQASAQDPSVIWCSITGFGQDGPYAQWAGHDITYTAHSGLLNNINPELPWHPQQVLAVPLGAMMAATAITSALYQRQQTGQGTHLDISLTESALWLLSGNDGEINGGRSGIPVSADRHLYRCSDGRYITTAAAEPRTWGALTKGLGLTELEGTSPHGADASVGERIAAAFATRPAAEWVAELGPAGAAIGMVNRGAELLDDPQLQARGALLDVDGVRVPASPIRQRTVDGPVGTDAPTPPSPVGADTRDVLSAAGYSDDDIQQLIADGVVAQAETEQP